MCGGPATTHSLISRSCTLDVLPTRGTHHWVKTCFSCRLFYNEIGHAKGCSLYPLPSLWVLYNLHEVQPAVRTISQSQSPIDPDQLAGTQPPPQELK
jgi:hypothetical protein